MRVVFRADASTQVATGHVMRCLTLAESLRERGADIHFLTRDLPGNLNGLIIERGFGLVTLSGPGMSPASYAATSQVGGWLEVDFSADAEETASELGRLAPVDWLVVDHYGIDGRWERVQRNRAGRILVIDDLANRDHDCDLLLDQNLTADPSSRYRGKVPEHCALRLGPEYALLRREFRLARAGRKPRHWPPRRILVNFGGSDASDLTALALAALCEVDDERLQVEVVSGRTHRGRYPTTPAPRNLIWHGSVNTMAEMMVGADFALGAGGGTTWERLYLQLPTMAIAIAENQVEQLQVLARRNCLDYLGPAESVDVGRLTARLRHVLTRPEWPHQCQLEIATRTVVDDMLGDASV
jgi:UDP-2,4-diacetamido-2,4,6-trideoxy-beta-L-altropyranose hydrolase